MESWALLHGEDWQVYLFWGYCGFSYTGDVAAKTIHSRQLATLADQHQSDRDGDRGDDVTSRHLSAWGCVGTTTWLGLAKPILCRESGSLDAVSRHPFTAWVYLFLYALPESQGTPFLAHAPRASSR